jgi:uncharacterized membrane protein
MMHEAFIKTTLKTLVKYGILPVFSVIFSITVKFLKEHPVISVGLLVGMFVGNWIAGIVSWIPLFGFMLGSFVVLICTFLGGYAAYKIQKKLEMNKRQFVTK